MPNYLDHRTLSREEKFTTNNAMHYETLFFNHVTIDST